jgi:hypothetical protein
MALSYADSNWKTTTVSTARHDVEDRLTYVDLVECFRTVTLCEDADERRLERERRRTRVNRCCCWTRRVAFGSNGTYWCKVRGRSHLDQSFSQTDHRLVEFERHRTSDLGKEVLGSIRGQVEDEVLERRHKGRARRTERDHAPRRYERISGLTTRLW